MHSWNGHNAAGVQILKQSDLAADVYLHVVQQWQTEEEEQKILKCIKHAS